jgi:hypothetical protein
MSGIVEEAASKIGPKLAETDMIFIVRATSCVTVPAAAAAAVPVNGQEAFLFKRSCLFWRGIAQTMSLTVTEKNKNALDLIVISYGPCVGRTNVSHQRLVSSNELSAAAGDKPRRA